MNVPAIVMAAAVAGVFSAGPILTSAQVALTGASPVKVTNFQYVYASPDDEVGLPQEGLMLTFKNVSPLVAKRVVFMVDDPTGFPLGTVTQHGTFSPNVDVTRYFGKVKMKHKHGDPTKAHAIEVQFANGSVWDAKKR